MTIRPHFALPSRIVQESRFFDWDSILCGMAFIERVKKKTTPLNVDASYIALLTEY